MKKVMMENFPAEIGRHFPGAGQSFKLTERKTEIFHGLPQSSGMCP